MQIAAAPPLVRTFDARRLNELGNHPDIRPTCGGDGQSHLDFSAFVANRDNYALVSEHGALLFFWSAPQTYEIHVMALPQGRGRETYDMVREGIDCIVAHGAERLWARVGKDADALRHLTAQSGLIRCGENVLDIGFGPVAYDLYQWKKPCPHQ